MRERFHEQLDELKSGMLDMIGRTNLAIKWAVDSFMTNDRELAHKVIGGDLELNRLAKDIQHDCTLLIALQQPMARDLRLIESIYKTQIDAERMGDLAVDIAKLTLDMSTEVNHEFGDVLSEMYSITESMLNEALEAFGTRNLELAYSVAKKDDAVDRMFYSIREKLIQHMIEKGKRIPDYSRVIFAAWYIERVADHITNICESVIYDISGEIVELN